MTSARSGALAPGIVSVHALYAIIALLFGGIFALITPPLAAPDELGHVFRAVTIARGILIEDPRGEPLLNRGSIYDGLDDELYAMRIDRAVALAPSRVASVSAHGLDCEPIARRGLMGAGAYPPLPYVVSATAYRLTCALHGPTGVFIYASRIGNLLVATLLTALAIRFATIGKWSLFALALLPTTLFQSASFSADSLSNAVAFLWIAYLACLFGGDQAIRTRQMFVGVSLALAMALCKPGYWLLILPVLLVRPSRFDDRHAWLRFVTGVVVLPLVLTGVWLYTVRDIVVVRAGIDPAANVARLREAPLGFIVALIRALHEFAAALTAQFIASLGVLDVALPSLAYVLLGALVLLSTALNPAKRFPTWPVRLSFIGAAAVSVVVFAVPLYVTFSDVAKRGLEGLQGRYFVPLAGITLLACAFDGRRWVERFRPRVLYPIGFAVALALSVAAIATRYYEPIGTIDPKSVVRYEGKVIRRLGSTAPRETSAYYVRDGQRWPVAAQWMRDQKFFAGDIIPVPGDVFDAMTEAPTRLEAGMARPKSRYEGRMIRRASPASGKDAGWYFVEDGQRRWVLDAGWIAAHGFSASDIVALDDAQFDAIPENPIPIIAQGKP